MSDPVLLAVDDRGVASLVLNRPQRHNALSQEMLQALTEAAAQLDKDPAVRVVVLTGTGPSFCAGGDLGWMQRQIDGSQDDRRAAAGLLAGMLQALNNLSKPLIAKVNGNAFGGGLGLISVSDVAIATEGARFGLTETRLGLIPATIGPYLVARMGMAKARRIFSSGRVFGADEAVRLDLLSRHVPAERLDTAIAEEISPWLACAPGAVSDAKGLLQRLGAGVSDETIAMTVEALVARWDSPEAEAGIRAFFAKEKPDWAR